MDKRVAISNINSCWLKYSLQLNPYFFRQIFIFKKFIGITHCRFFALRKKQTCHNYYKVNGCDDFFHDLVFWVYMELCLFLSLIHISEPTRLGMISYAVFCLKKKK